MYIKNDFSIKDLEHLTHVKAHTIRIWEKRYNILSPQRSDTNIRSYDIDHLKKLLNITFLYNQGYKISKIAQLREGDIKDLVETSSLDKKGGYAVKEFKKTMFEFDRHKFNQIYDEISQDKSFREVFTTILIPLLDEIGILWQTGTIDPIHESFISECIKQKIAVATDQQKIVKKWDTPVFVLFLPENELHDIGLMYANFELVSAGFKTIYLGSSIPIDNLTNLYKYKSEVCFITYLTIQPSTIEVNNFIHKLSTFINDPDLCKLWIMGPRLNAADFEPPNSDVLWIKNFDHFFKSIAAFKDE